MSSFRLACVSAILVFAIACSGDDPPTPTAPSAPIGEAPPAAPQPPPPTAPAPPTPAPPTTPPPPPAPPPTPEPTPTPSPQPGGQTASVTIPVGAEFLGRGAYVPGELSIAVGTTVTWVNTDSTTHTSTSNASGFDSGFIRPGGQFSVAFDTAGTFPYHCEIHPSMVGTVVVR